MAAISDFFDAMHGVIFPFGGTTAPPGFLLCDGKAYSRTEYAALFAVIGTTFGSGDGSTTFNVPDLRGRVVAGKDNMGGASAGRITNSGTGNPGIDGQTLGAAGGVDRYTLTTAQMPQHTHAILSDKDNPTGSSYILRSQFGVSDPESQATTQAAGSNQPHPNVQPTMILNFIIKT